MSPQTGRRLDDDGAPVPGTGFEYDDDGPLAEHLHDRCSPLFSNPVTDEWTTMLVTPAETGGESVTGLGVFAPGNDGPPEHYHVGYEESFAVLRGELVVDIDGETNRLRPGDEITVPPETPHGFAVVGDGLAATLTTTRPAARTLDVVRTLYGLAHEGALDADGKPGLLQSMALAAAMSDDTVFTSPPPVLARPLARLVAPLANRLGYEATYDRFEREQFWRERVEQPGR
ncbi:cupin domain-containing protein [Haloarchaeobius baliensis]|uniref:cupin domain-containing protein n=1 Tax=Haloarchaeobius baliensis TaxID=1670458 RepID=UPI003F882B73